MAFDAVDAHNKMVNDARIKAIMRSQEQIESSGGKNVNHSEVDYGMHKGYSAKGRYGIMPATLKDLAKGMGKDKEAQEASSIEDEQQLKEYFASHPELEDRLARQYIERANKSMGGDYDPEKITYAWQWGQNKTPEDYEKAKNDPAVKERWAKVKGLFKDPYPYQGPAGKSTEESEFAGVTPIIPGSTPNPAPNISPQEDFGIASAPTPEAPVASPLETGIETLGKLVSPKVKVGEQEMSRPEQVSNKLPEPKEAVVTPTPNLQPKDMKKIMALMGARRL